MLVKLSDRQTRIEDVGDQNRAVETLHHPAKNRRLARANFARDRDQTLAAFDAVVKIGHHFGMRRREIDVARIGSQREWHFFQSVKFCVHVSSGVAPT